MSALHHARRRAARRWLGAAALACALLQPRPARAYERSVVEGSDPPVPLFWCTRAFAFVVNERGSKSAGSPSFDAVRLGYSAWAGPNCTDLSFVDQTPTPRLDVGFDAAASDNINLVVWRETNCALVVPASDPCLEEGGCNNRYGCWEDANYAIALTTTTYNKRTGEIYDADIEFNGAGFAFSTVDEPPCTEPPTGRPTCVAADIQATTTHEVGHVLGLDHSDLRDATMYFEADLGETKKRTLHQDDVDGLCSIYPKGVPTAQCAQGLILAYGRCGCGAAAAGPSWLATALGALVLLARRRRGPEADFRSRPSP